MFTNNKKETLDIILEESLKKFSNIKPEDRVLYGKNYGNNELLAFAKYIDPNFVTPRHIKLIADKLEAVEKGKIKRLIISIPPRFGKSYLTSQMFLAWLLGRDPRREVILASYNDEKAEEYTRWVRDTCNYDLFKKVFPDFAMNEKKQASGEWYTLKGGKVIAAGIKGGVTGYGAHFMLIDDPVKDFEQATSDLIQEKIWNRYRADIRTRLYPGAVIVIIMTRWTSNDLVGRLIENEGLLKEGGKWDVLSLPILDAKGKSLWPEYYSLKEIQDIRESVGEKIFQSLYQQTPVDLIDRIFSDPIFREPPPSLPAIGYIDPAFGGDDFSSLTTGGLYDDNGIKKAYITGGWTWNSQIDKSYDIIEKIYKLAPELFKKDVPHSEFPYNKDRMVVDMYEDIAVLNGWQYSELKSQWDVIREKYRFNQQKALTEGIQNLDTDDADGQLNLFDDLEERKKRAISIAKNK